MNTPAQIEPSAIPLGVPCVSVVKGFSARELARMARRPVVAFEIPYEDVDEFHTLGVDECAHVRRVLWVLEDIHTGFADVRDGFKFHARQLAVDGVRGWGESNIKTNYYNYVRAGKKSGQTRLFEPGDWRMLARHQRQCGYGLSGRPEFLRLWQSLCDNHQRVMKSAFRDLASLYTTGFTRDGRKLKGVEWGTRFPGYEGWPEAVPHTGLPEGWTFSSLTRHAPDKVERVAARRGIKAASGVGLKARFSRVGLLPFQQLSGDDAWLDVNCLSAGERKAVRPRCLGLHDAATDAFVSFVVKSTWRDTEAGVLRGLSERDTMWFIVGYLMNTGYRADTGTEITAELGTFAIRGDTCNPPRPIEHPDRHDLEARLWRATGGRVTVKRGSGFQRAAHPGQFAPPVGSNPRMKRIEGRWSCLHNRLDGLVGNVGRNRDNCPESMSREEALAVQTLKQLGLLDAAQAEATPLPFLTFPELAAQAHRAVAEINNDPDHEIKEWEKCGYVVKEYWDEVAGGWFPAAGLQARITTLAAAHVEQLAASLQANEGFRRVRRMTRAEALATGKAGLRRLPLSALLEIVGRENAMNGGELKGVSGGEFTFNVKEIDRDEIAFKAVDREGRPLREGARYLCLVNPLFPDACVIYDADGRFVSVCPRHEGAPLADPSATMREVGEKKLWIDSKLTRMRSGHDEDAARVDFIRQHRELTQAGGRAATVEDKARARKVAGFEGDMDFATAETQPAVAVAGDEDTFDPEELL